jgi:hypothetical protein
MLKGYIAGFWALIGPAIEQFDHEKAVSQNCCYGVSHESVKVALDFSLRIN